jgi:hypothetical protein
MKNEIYNFSFECESHFKKLTCTKDFQCFENFNVTHNNCWLRNMWCNQLLNMLGMCNLKLKAITYESYQQNN